MKKIKIKKLRDIPLPEYRHLGDSGMDLINAGDNILIAPGQRALVPAGIKVAVPDGWEIQIRSRSGLAVKDGIMVLNSPGTIDAGYRGEIGVILFNTSKEPFTVARGMRIAQAVLQKIEKIEWIETNRLKETFRNGEGFGSTGS